MTLATLDNVRGVLEGAGAEFIKNGAPPGPAGAGFGRPR